MAALSTSTSSHLLMHALEEKVTLLISQSLVTTLEIAQLQQENARLMTQLGERDIPTAKLINP
ncbi:hypothetical protein ABXT70_01650 [Candidatus Njordibacter sp. Uisw_039]|jgi:hypothetical protein|uniref:hypothetical protein n=1 Tax=Candidatus Njordibacter sp. Uisw_039 TaxID=3230972 RepID=UPI003A1E7F2E|tara:strand:+ start:4186 stop:4374 length:189 start_codon:yes stop_codon:yes gene_type:complete